MGKGFIAIPRFSDEGHGLGFREGKVADEKRCDVELRLG